MQIQLHDLEICYNLLADLASNPKAPADFAALAKSILPDIKQPIEEFRTRRNKDLVDKHGSKNDPSDPNERPKLRTAEQRQAYKDEVRALRYATITIRNLNSEEKQFLQIVRLTYWMQLGGFNPDEDSLT